MEFYGRDPSEGTDWREVSRVKLGEDVDVISAPTKTRVGTDGVRDPLSQSDKRKTHNCLV